MLIDLYTCMHTMNILKIKICIMIFISIIVMTPEVYGEENTEYTFIESKKHSFFGSYWPVEGSKYLAQIQVQVYNPDGKLVGVIASDTILYSPHELTDKLLNSFPAIEVVVKDGISYEKREIKATVSPDNEKVFPITNLFSSKTKDRIVVFQAMHHAYVVDKGDTYKIKWTILSET